MISSTAQTNESLLNSQHLPSYESSVAVSPPRYEDLADVDLQPPDVVVVNPPDSDNERPADRRDGFMRLDSIDTVPRHKRFGRSLLCGPVRRPWLTWLLASAMVIAALFGLATNRDLTGSFIQTSPFNPMVGPKFTLLIHMGARYTPCMRPLPGYSPLTLVQDCYQTKEADTCTLQALCGFDQEPNQAFRFVSPHFIHAGIVHLAIDILVLILIGARLERDMGCARFIVLYLVSGIYGFVLSATFASDTSASMGCSGALLGLTGYTISTTMLQWKSTERPIRKLLGLALAVVCMAILGLFPGVDNFAHIGGLVAGSVLCAVFSRPELRTGSKTTSWILRVVTAVVFIALFIVPLYIFYSTTDPGQICPNCRYLSCIPVSNWCMI